MTPPESPIAAEGPIAAQDPIPDLEAWVTEEVTLYLQHARSVIEGGHEFMPSGLLFLPDLSCELIGMPFSNEHEKAACAAAMKLRCQETGAVAALFTSDTWTASGPDPEDPEGTRFNETRAPHDRPDRQEALIASLYFPEKRRFSMQKYRREPGTIRWGPLETIEEAEMGDAYDRFDPFPRPGQEPQPDLNELALQHGLGVTLVPTKPGETELDWEHAKRLTNPVALDAGELLRSFMEELLTARTDFPGSKPWES